MSDGPLVDAWKAAVAVAVAPWQAFGNSEIQDVSDQDEGPDVEVPPMYVVVSVTRRAAEPLRMCGSRPLLGWRMQTLAVGTTAHEVEWLRDRIRRVLMDKQLPALESSPLRPDGESDFPEARKDGCWEALDSWIYNAPNV